MKQHRVFLFTAVASSVIACSSSGNSTSISASQTKPNPNLISTAEIESVPNARDGREIIQKLRPTWLTRAKSEGITMSGTSMAGSVGNSSRGGLILVYLDNARLGDIRALSDIPINAISTIQFMDPSTATALLPGLSSYTIAGAIVVHSRAGR